MIETPPFVPMRGLMNPLVPGGGAGEPLPPDRMVTNVTCQSAVRKVTTTRTCMDGSSVKSRKSGRRIKSYV